MLLTAECRWFFEGEPPDGGAWFFATEERPAPEEQTDRYLRLPGCDGVGVKVRAHRLEVKARQGDPYAVAWKDAKDVAVKGRAARWLKWTTGEPIEAISKAARTSRSEWIAVGKKRWQRVFVTEGGAAREVEPGTDERGDGLGAVELARVVIDEGAPWWSLAFEAGGAEPEKTLAIVAPAFLGLVKLPVKLVEDASRPYPRVAAPPRT